MKIEASASWGLQKGLMTLVAERLLTPGGGVVSAGGCFA